MSGIIEKFIETIFNKKEIIFLVFLSATCLILYRLQYFSYIFLALFGLFGQILFIIIKNRISVYGETFSHHVPFNLSSFKSFNLSKIFSIIFFISYSSSLIILPGYFYMKDFVYYIFIAICAAVLIAEIFVMETKRQGVFNLLKSFLLVLNVTLSNQIVFVKGIALPDFGLHFNKFVLHILNTGYINEQLTGVGKEYQYFPIHHILSAIQITVLHSEPRMTYILFGGFLLSLCLVFLFLIGKNFINFLSALVIAIMFTCLDYFLMYGSHPEHQAYNYAFTLILLSVILIGWKHQDRRFFPIIFIIMIATVFIHHFSAIIILSILAVLYFVEYIQKRTDFNRLSYLRSIFLIFGIVLLTQWIYYSELFSNLVGILEAYYNAFLNPSAHILSQTVYDTLSINSIFLNSIGSGILIFLSMIGFNLYLKKKNSKIKNFVLSALFILFIFIIVGIFFKQVALLPDRLYPYLQIFALIFLAAEGLIALTSVINSNYYKLTVIMIIIGLLSFFSCASTIAGFETSPFTDEKMSYFKLFSTPHESEYQEWIQKYGLENIILIEQLPVTREETISFNNIPGNSYLAFDRIYLRTGFIKQYGGHLGQYHFIRLQKSEENKLNIFDKFYDNGIMNSYLKY